MAFSESLTVRILGDSSGLQRELSRVLQSIDDLHQRVESTTRATGQVGTALSRISQATSPLQQVSSLLTRISQQSRLLSQQPVNLNVTPAINSLQRLMQSISAVAIQLRNLSAVSAVSSMPSFTPMVGPSVTSPTTRRMASGGLIVGPSGIDRIPTQLTAGEYVLNQQTVQTLGHSFVEQLNRRPETILGTTQLRSTVPLNDLQRSTAPSTTSRTSFQPVHTTTPGSGVNVSPVRAARTPEAINQTTSNHFGGITVVVNQVSEVGELVQRIEQQQRALRNRRG